MARKSPALPAGRAAATKYAKEIRPGVWQYTSGPTKGRFAPTRNGLPFLPGWKKDKAGRAYNVQERQERAKRTIQVPTPRGKEAPSKTSYARRYGVSPLGGIRTVYAKVTDQERIKSLQEEYWPNYWDQLLDWARKTFAKGPLPNSRGWLIVGQSGKATHWRAYNARWSVKSGWSIRGSAITEPDIELTIDAGHLLVVACSRSMRLAEERMRKEAEEEGKSPVPIPTIALNIPIKRIKPSRWEKLTSK